MAAGDASNNTTANTTDVGIVADVPVLPPPPAPADVAPSSTAWTAPVLRQPLSKLQALVGVTAGIISVFSVVGPIAGNVKIPVSGEFVGVVEEARSRKPLRQAAVEISSRNGHGVVATVVSDDEGRVHVPLKEGQYRVRVSHREFKPEMRHVLVIGGQTAEVHLGLTPRVVAVARPAVPVIDAKPVAKKPTAIRRWFTGRDVERASHETVIRPQTP